MLDIHLVIHTVEGTLEKRSDYWSDYYCKMGFFKPLLLSLYREVKTRQLG